MKKNIFVVVAMLWLGLVVGSGTARATIVTGTWSFDVTSFENAFRYTVPPPAEFKGSVTLALDTSDGNVHNIPAADYTITVPTGWVTSAEYQYSVLPAVNQLFLEFVNGNDANNFVQIFVDDNSTPDVIVNSFGSYENNNILDGPAGLDLADSTTTSFAPAVAVAEPGSLALLGTALVALGLGVVVQRWRRTRRSANRQLSPGSRSR